MSELLPKEPQNFNKITNKRIAIVSSLWHQSLLSPCIDFTIKELLKLGVKQQHMVTHWVPGSMEIPFAAKTIFTRQANIDAIIAFGIVLKGITNHDQQVMQSVTDGIRQVSLEYQKPIINEVVSFNNINDAAKRFGNSNIKATEAVFAVSEILNWQNNIN